MVVDKPDWVKAKEEEKQKKEEAELEMKIVNLRNKLGMNGVKESGDEETLNCVVEKKNKRCPRKVEANKRRSEEEDDEGRIKRACVREEISQPTAINLACVKSDGNSEN